MSLIVYTITKVQFMTLIIIKGLEYVCCCCLPTPLTHASREVCSTRLWSTSQLLSPSGQQYRTPAGYAIKSRGNNVVCMWRNDVCCVCECYKWGIVVINVIWRRLCVSMIWERVIYFSELGKGATSEADMYCFRADNVWLRCAQ